MTPDQVCAKWAELGVSLRIDIKRHEAESPGQKDETFVLAEGERKTLRFLGELLLAQADSETDCHFFIHPSGPGSALFSPRSTLGVSIHRLPCPDGPL